jgi:hypothetical protein
MPYLFIADHAADNKFAKLVNFYKRQFLDAASLVAEADIAIKYPAPAVRAENLNPDVLVMQPANQGVRHDASDLLNRARDRRILVQ